MSLTAYWKTTTGFNVEDYPVTLGKQLNQCTAAELAAHPMCGANASLANTCYVGKVADLLYSSVLGHIANAQFKDPPPNAMTNTWVCEPCVDGDDRLIYSRTIFIAIPTNKSIPQYCLTDQCDNSFLIVDNITAPNKLVYNYGTINFSLGATPIFRTGGLALKHTCQKGQSTYSSAPGYVVYTDYTDPDNPVTTNYNIILSHLYIADDDAFLVNFDYIGNFGGRYKNNDATNCYNMIGGGSSYTSFNSDNGNALFLGINVNATGSETNLQGIFGDDIFADPVPNPPVFVNTYIDYAPTNIVLQNVKLRFNLSNSTISGSIASRALNILLYDTEEIRKQQMARGGVYFVINGELFKPKISGGIVIGYCTPEQESEIDTYNDLNHPVPSGGGGGGGPSGDDIDPYTFGGGSKLGGADTLWLLTSSQLSDLHNAFNTNNDPNFEPLNSIISVMGLAIPPTYPIGDDISTLSEIKIKKADGTAWSSGVSGHVCTSQRSAFGLTGNIKIQRRYDSFLDYPPYASHEIFIPLCGWLSLPAFAIGRTLKVYYVPDVQTCAVRAIVFADGCLIGEKYGAMGANIPITSNGHGLMLGGVISGGVQLLADFATAMGGVALDNPLLALAGGTRFAADGANLALAANQNRTSVIGQNQDRTSFSDGTEIRIKSTYHKIKEDPLFGHTHGYACCKSGHLSSFKGFTICENPHVNINCTSVEREEIAKLLQEGVILP